MSHSKTKNHGQAFWGVVAALAVVALVYTSFSDTVGGQTSAGAPSEPRNFVGTATETGVNLTWVAPRNGTPTGYVLQYEPVLSSGRPTTVNLDHKATSYTTLIDWSAGAYTFALHATSAAGDGAVATVTVDPLEEETAEIIGLDVSVSGTTASFSWTTDPIDADVQAILRYSLVESMLKSKSEIVNPDRDGIYTLNAANLLSCTQYWYTLDIYTQAGKGGLGLEIVDSQSGTFRVYGCKGGSDMLSVKADRVTTSQSSALNVENGNSRLTVIAPSNVVSGEGLFLQAAKLEKEKVESDISVPSGRVWIGESAYSIKAMVDENSEFSNGFENPVEVKMEYNTADLPEGIDENTLTIWHHENGNGWMPLNSCTREKNGSTGVVTCLTGSFSIFGLFGQPASQGGNGGDGGNENNGGATPPPAQTGSSSSTVIGSVAVLPTQPTQPVAPTQTTPSTSNKFTRNLWRGVTHNEVKILQETLNKLGFTVSSSGAGSTGSETTFFGPLTEQAVIKFQEAYMEQVLAPFGLRSGTGYFGQLSRNMMESLMGN